MDVCLYLGTCVNVGCIPKKLYHTAALLGEQLRDAKRYGWNVNLLNLEFRWERMLEGVRNHIMQLNFGYAKELFMKNVIYINEYASLVDKNTVQGKDADGKTVFEFYGAYFRKIIPQKIL